jgi:hypothetical protein
MVNWEGCGWKLSTPNWGAIPAFVHMGTEENNEKPGQDCRWPGQDSNRAYFSTSQKLYCWSPIRLRAWCTLIILFLSHLAAHFKVKHKSCGDCCSGPFWAGMPSDRCLLTLLQVSFCWTLKNCECNLQCRMQSRHVRMWRQMKPWHAQWCVQSLPLALRSTVELIASSVEGWEGSQLTRDVLKAWSWQGEDLRCKL